MTGLFETFSHRFSQPAAILPRRRLRFEGAAGLHEQAADWPHAETPRPGDMPDARAPRRNAAQPAAPAGVAPDPRGSPENRAPDRRAASPVPSGQPAAPEPAIMAAPPRPASDRAPDAKPAPAPGGISASAPSAGPINPDWQHSAMPPLTHATDHPAPQPVATVVEVTHATPPLAAQATQRAPETAPAAPDRKPAPAARPEDAAPRVEIHIGRIEVAAAKPSPAPGPAPGPASPARPAPASGHARRPSSAPARPGLTDYLGWKR